MFRQKRYYHVIQNLTEHKYNLSDLRQAQQGVKHSFVDLEQYICILSFGAKIEEAITERGQTEHFESHIRILTPKSPDENRFTALLFVPSDCRAGIETDGKAMICFKVAQCLRGEEDKLDWEKAH